MATAPELMVAHADFAEPALASVTNTNTDGGATKPVCNLVPDILIDIFQRLRSMYVAEDPDSLEWTRVTGVCQQWRAVALASPGLWRHNPVRNSFQFHRFIERSQRALLDVFGTIPPGDNLLSGVSSVMGHIQNLRLTVAPDDFTTFLEAVKAGSADNLRAIDLNCGDYHREINADDCWWYSSPNLESFAFTSRKGVSLSDMPRLSTLRCLKIVQTNRLTRPGGQIISMLRKLPALESLHLEGLLPNAISQGEAEDLLTLPLLKFLALGGTPQRCSNFLHCVRLPGLEYLNFVGCVLTSDNGLSTLVNTLRDHIRDRRSPTEFQSLRYEEGDNCHKTTVTLWTTHDEPGAALPPRAFHVRLVVHHDNYASSMRSICSILPVQSVQNLHVYVGSTEKFGVVEGTLATFPRWKTTFQSLMQVSRVSITGYFPYELLDELCGTKDSENGGLLEWLYGPAGTHPTTWRPSNIIDTPSHSNQALYVPVWQRRPGAAAHNVFAATTSDATDLAYVVDPMLDWTADIMDVDTVPLGDSDDIWPQWALAGPPAPPPGTPAEHAVTFPPFTGYDFDPYDFSIFVNQGHYAGLEHEEDSDAEPEPEPEAPPTPPHPPVHSPPTPTPTRWNPSEWQSGLFPLFDYDHFKAEHISILQPSPGAKGKRAAHMVPDPSGVAAARQREGALWHLRHSTQGLSSHPTYYFPWAGSN